MTTTTETAVLPEEALKVHSSDYEGMLDCVCRSMLAAVGGDKNLYAEQELIYTVMVAAQGATVANQIMAHFGLPLPRPQRQAVFRTMMTEDWGVAFEK